MSGLQCLNLVADILLGLVVLVVSSNLALGWWYGQRQETTAKAALFFKKAGLQSPRWILVGLAGGGLKIFVSVAMLLGYQ